MVLPEYRGARGFPSTGAVKIALHLSVDPFQEMRLLHAQHFPLLPDEPIRIRVWDVYVGNLNQLAANNGICNERAPFKRNALPQKHCTQHDIRIIREQAIRFVGFAHIGRAAPVGPRGIGASYQWTCHDLIGGARKLTFVEMRRSHDQQFVAEQLFLGETGPVPLPHSNADVGQAVPHVLYLKTRLQAHAVIRMALPETR